MSETPKNAKPDLYKNDKQIAEALAYCETAGAHYGPFRSAVSILAIALKALRTAEAERAERIARGKMLLRHRIALTLIADEIDDEGDRAYFGSTNDADELREVARELEEFHWDRLMAERDAPDLLASCRAANEKVRELETLNKGLMMVIADLDAVCPANWSDEDDEQQARAWAAAKKALGHPQTGGDGQ